MRIRIIQTTVEELEVEIDDDLVPDTPAFDQAVESARVNTDAAEWTFVECRDHTWEAV